MERKGFERFAPLAGLVFLALAIASFVIGGDPPSVDDSTAEQVEFWNDEETSQIISALLAVYAGIALLWFGGVVRANIACAERAGGRLASVAFGGAVVCAGGIASNAAIQFAAAESADDVPPQVTQTLGVLYSDFFFPMALGLAVLLLASGLAAVRHGVFDRRLGWMAIVIGILCVTPLGFFGFLASLIWIGIAGVVLYRKADPVGSGAAPPPPAGPEAPA